MNENNPLVVPELDPNQVPTEAPSPQEGFTQTPDDQGLNDTVIVP